MLACTYQYKRNIGTGTYGLVTEVYDPVSKKSYALKELLNQPYGILNLTEIDILFRIRSPYILRSFKFFNTGECGSPQKVINKWVNKFHPVGEEYKEIGTYSYIFSLYDGDLAKYFLNVDVTNRQKYTNFKKAFFQVALGLRCLHDNGFLHLDIKPENILYKQERDFHVVLSDNGLSELLTDTIENGLYTNQEKITMNYRAPSDHLPRGSSVHYHYTNKSDIWSLGMTFLTLVRGNYHPIYDRVMDVGQFQYLTNLNLADEKINPQMERFLRQRDLPANEKNQLIDLFVSMLRLNPTDRYDIHQVIEHKYFNDIRQEVLRTTGEECRCSGITPFLSDTVEPNKIASGIEVIMVMTLGNKNLNIAIYFLAIDIFMRCMPACGGNINEKEIQKFAITSFGMALKYYTNFNNPVLESERNQKMILELEGKIIKLFGGIINRNGPYFYASSLDELKAFHREIIDDKSKFKYYLAIDLPEFYKMLNKKYSFSKNSKNVTVNEFDKKGNPELLIASEPQIITM